MTKQGKIIITISSLIFIGGASYLLYKYFGKPTPTESPKPEDKPTKTETFAKSSQYGFNPSDKLWAKRDVESVFSYPENASKYRIGYFKKQATNNGVFISDANAKGWIKVKMDYIDKNNKPVNGDVYIMASSVTNMEP